MAPFLEMHGISKSFPGVRALDGVDLTVERGEVLALVGENGAGKSTLMKVLTGVYHADAGHISVEGVPVTIHDPEHARRLGINIIYQELSTVDNLSVAENIFLAKEPLTRLRLIDGRRMLREARQVLDTLHVSVDPRTIVGDLSVGQKQMVEVAKAIYGSTKIIVMDEPTSSLSIHEADDLLEQVKRLRKRGIGVVYITHRLDEVFEIADRVTVLRDGRTVDSRPIASMTRELLVRKMVDRELSQLYGEHALREPGEVVMSVRGLTLTKRTRHTAPVADVSFDLHRNEILGFFGLVGAGRTEIMEMIFGVRPYSGEIRIGGERVEIRNPSTAIRLGIGFVTEDRKGQGLILGMAVRENFSLSHLEDYCWHDFVDVASEGAACRDYVHSLGIKTPSIEQQVVNLSGGNQQKVIIAKWVARRPRILIADEPTRGIDVGAKAEVHALLNQLADQGVGILLISSDLPEVLAVCDRIIIVKNGQISGTLMRTAADREQVMGLATD
jgi:ABC-type sugar transport system ATPase subunit